MSISTRKAGTITICPRCDSETQVPEQESPVDQETEAASDLTPAQPVLSEADPANDDEANQQLDQPASEETQPEQTAPAEYSPLQLAPRSEDQADEELEFQFRRSESEFDDLDMTPMVDVTFLLLIFFMVTASFSIQKSIEVPPPDPDQQGAAQTVQPLEELEENSILIEIDEENRFFVESEPLNDPRDLPSVLAEVRSRDSKYEVVVSVDERTHHESVVIAIDAAQEVGMQRIRWGVNSND